MPNQQTLALEGSAHAPGHVRISRAARHALHDDVAADSHDRKREKGGGLLCRLKPMAFCRPAELVSA
jgi:hypothetical protein